MARAVLRAVTTVEASELGLKPGEWPTEVKWEGWTWTAPEFERRVVNGEAELLHVSYRCNGRRLVVIND